MDYPSKRLVPSTKRTLRQALYLSSQSFRARIIILKRRAFTSFTRAAHRPQICYHFGQQTTDYSLFDFRFCIGHDHDAGKKYLVGRPTMLRSTAVVAVLSATADGENFEIFIRLYSNLPNELQSHGKKGRPYNCVLVRSITQCFSRACFYFNDMRAFSPHVCCALFATYLHMMLAFYLPGVAPHDFQRGERVELKVNKLTSTRTQVSAACTP